MFECPAFVISAVGFAPAAASLVIELWRRSWNGPHVAVDPSRALSAALNSAWNVSAR